jgi:hypothetical protein
LNIHLLFFKFYFYVYEKMKQKTSMRVSVIVLVFLSLSLIFAVSAVDAAVVVKVEPASQTVTPGDSFSVNVRVEDVTYMAANGACLNFDPGAMQATEVVEGDFLKSAGATLPFTIIDNTAGTATFAYALSSGGVTGSGVLATINFDTSPAAGGVFNFDLTNVLLSDGDGNPITVDVKSDGTVTIGSESTPTPTPTPTPIPTIPSNGGGGSGSDGSDTTPTPTPTPIPTPTFAPTSTPTSTPTVTSTQAEATVVKLEPTTQNVTAGQSFSVDVRVEGVTYMGAEEADLKFDPDAMQATEIIEGDFLNSVAGGGGTLAIEDIDNTNGIVTFSYSLMKPGVGASGSGVLATITFNTTSAAGGEYTFDLTTVLLLDGDGHEITVDDVSGSKVKIQPVPSPRSGTGMVAAISILAIAFAISSAMRKRRK